MKCEGNEKHRKIQMDEEMTDVLIRSDDEKDEDVLFTQQVMGLLCIVSTLPPNSAFHKRFRVHLLNLK